MIIRSLIATSILLLNLGCGSEQVELSTAADTSYFTLCGAKSATSLLTDDSLPAPKQLTGIGNSHLPITTDDPQVQAWFDQGINLLHSFNHIEAYRAFRQGLQLAPQCPMLHWGIAMCQPGFGDNPAFWQAAVNKASTLAADTQVLPVEADLIQALSITLSQGLPAAKDYWQNIVRNHADQYPDALAFAAIMLRQVVSSEAQSNNMKYMLEVALDAYPDHVGLGHYYVHVMETRNDFVDGKDWAEKVADLAPNSSHLMHMPGHIYFLEGDYEKTVQTFEKAYALDVDYHNQTKIPFAANQNYTHNLHYLTVAYAELGEKEKALQAAERFAGLTIQNTEELSGNAQMILYEGRILPALVHLRFHEYQAAARKISHWLQHPDLQAKHPMVRDYLQGMQAYCEAMQAVMDNKSALAQQHQERLQSFVTSFEQRWNNWQRPTELTAIQQVYDVLAISQLQLQGWLDNLNPKETFQHQAWEQALALEQQLPYDEPPRLLAPVGESLLYLQLHRKNKSAAAEAAQLALARRPHSPLIERALSQGKTNYNQ